MPRTKAPKKAVKEKKKIEPTVVEVSGGRSHDEMMMLDKILNSGGGSSLPVEGLRRRVKKLMCDEFLCDKSFGLIKELFHKMIEDFVHDEDDKKLMIKKIGECINNAHTTDLKVRKEMLEYEWYNKINK